MKHYVVRWDLEPGYAEFVGVPEGTCTLEVWAAETVADAATKAEHGYADQPPHDTQTDRISAVWEVGTRGDRNDDALVEWLEEHTDVRRLQWDWDADEWMVFTDGERPLYEPLIPAYMRPDNTDDIERAQLAGGGLNRG